MATNEGLNHRIERYLTDLIALEASGMDGLKGMAENAIFPEDAAIFQQHLMETEQQKMRLEARLHALGGTTNTFKEVMNKIGVTASGLLHASHDAGDKATRNLLEAYTIENLEIASYQSLYSAASEIGDNETAALAKEIMSEEETAAKKIFARIDHNARTAMHQG